MDIVIVIGSDQSWGGHFCGKAVTKKSGELSG